MVTAKKIKYAKLAPCMPKEGRSAESEIMYYSFLRNE